MKILKLEQKQVENSSKSGGNLVANWKKTGPKNSHDFHVDSYSF